MIGLNDLLVMPEDLRKFAWSAPMRDLAAKVNMSDVGLKKLLASHGVPSPPQGYWNKLHAGKPVPTCPKAPGRRPGENGRVRLDSRFMDILPRASPRPSGGPFASAAVPEDLDDLFAQELKAIGRAGVPKSFDRTHHGIAQILKRDQERKEKSARERWYWDTARFDSPLDKRRLRILNAVLLTLARRGHEGDAYERDGELHASAIIGDTRLGLAVDIAGSHHSARRRGGVQPASDLPAKTPLAFHADLNFDGKSVESWQDDADGILEAKIAIITAGLIVAGEAKFRRGLRDAEERAEQLRILEEKRRQEVLAARNRERLEHLRLSGELLHQAEMIRVLITRVRQAMLDGSVEVDAQTIAAWESWALGEADKLDPVLSGQIMTHLRPSSR